MSEIYDALQTGDSGWNVGRKHIRSLNPHLNIHSAIPGTANSYMYDNIQHKQNQMKDISGVH